MTDDFSQERSPSEIHDHHHARRFTWGWWAFAAIALFYLLSEHRAHFFGVLPYLFLFACPLMHRFMHHGHHGSHRHHEQSKDEEARK
ncbi:MAG TPA: DUF2933 domain-containing protein [Rhodocyclaceae bacterium]|jgi:hypothetical protein